MIKIRVDDFPWTKREERDRHNLDAFMKFQDVINRWMSGYWLLGVIPGNCSGDDLYTVKHKCPYARVGMHGIMHDESRPNEFLPYLTCDDIGKQLGTTRQLLSSAIEKDVRVYMPPHNVIDTRTLAALKPAGFRAWTGGPETDKNLWSIDALQYIHSEAPHQYGRSDELLARGSVAHLIRESTDRNIWLTLHWTWETNIGLEHLWTFLREIEGNLSMEDCKF